VLAVCNFGKCQIMVHCRCVGNPSWYVWYTTQLAATCRLPPDALIMLAPYDSGTPLHMCIWPDMGCSVNVGCQLG
jgi:hypothetical protein